MALALAPLDEKRSPSQSVKRCPSYAGSLPAVDAFYKQPSYTVVNVYGAWTPATNENITLRLGVDNLFDRDYFERSSYATSSTRGGIDPVYAPGRTVTINAALKF